MRFRRHGPGIAHPSGAVKEFCHSSCRVVVPGGKRHEIGVEGLPFQA
jgi:hypothetical protein